MLEGEFEKVLLVNPQHIKGQAQDGSAGCEVAGIKEQLRRLLTIPGVERMTVWTIPAEVGAEAQAFEDARHLASWAGLYPGNRESAGKRMSGRTRAQGGDGSGALHHHDCL